MVQYNQLIKLISVIVLIISTVAIRFIFKPKGILQLIRFYEIQYTEYLQSEYEMYYSSLFDDEDGDIDDNDSDIELTADQIKNKNYYYNQQKGMKSLFQSCNSKIFKSFNASSQIPDDIKIYFDWDDQFNNIQSMFNYKPLLQNASQQKNNTISQLQLKLNEKLFLSIIEETSNETDIIFTQNSLKQGRFDFISSLCYNQIFNHIPGSNFLFGKQSLIDLHRISTKKHRYNLKCLLEMDFYPRIFDLRDDCITFQDYINMNHLKENNQVFYISIQGIYKPNYSIFSLNSQQDSPQNTNIMSDDTNNKNISNIQDKNQVFSCMKFWTLNQKYQRQQFLVQEVNMNQEMRQNNTKISQDSYDNYLLRVNFLISSTKPLIVYCQNNDLVFLKCKIGSKCNKRIKSHEFFKQYPSLNQEIIFKKIFKIITHTILAVKSLIFHDSRVFELFTADFSVQQKQTLKLEEIYQFTTIYKFQDTGYDTIQKKFIKESFLIISQQFTNKINKFNEIFSKKVQNTEEDIQNLFKQQDKNDKVYLPSNFTEIIINENLTGSNAYKYISQSCYS